MKGRNYDIEKLAYDMAPYVTDVTVTPSIIRDRLHEALMRAYEYGRSHLLKEIEDQRKRDQEEEYYLPPRL